MNSNIFLKKSLLAFIFVLVTNDARSQNTIIQPSSLLQTRAQISISDSHMDFKSVCARPDELFPINLHEDEILLEWFQFGTANMWHIQYDSAGFQLGNGNFIYNVDTNPYNLTGLQANYSYDIYIRSFCAPGDSSSWESLKKIQTLCQPYTAPWSEDFENGGMIPDCWRNGRGVTIFQPFSYSTTPVNTHVGNMGSFKRYTKSRGHFGYMDDSVHFTAHNDRVLLSPKVDVSSLSSPELSFYFISHGEGSANEDFSIDVWDGSQWNLRVFENDSNTYLGDWEYIVVDLSSLNITGSIQLRFYIDVTASWPDNDDVAIDDVSIHEKPACAEPRQIEVTNTSFESADIQWIVVDSANAWQVTWGEPGFTQGVQTLDYFNTQINLPGLPSDSCLEIRVRAVCGLDTSMWSAPVPIKTPFEYCSGFDFYDTGGPAGLYSNGENNTYTFCPDTFSNKSIAVEFTSFSIVPFNDALYVFDGPNVGSNLIHSGNGPTSVGFPAGGFYGTKIIGPFYSTHSTGCLSFQFRSDFQLTLSSGWHADVFCTSPPCINNNVLPADTILCTDDNFLLSAPSGAYTYLWSNGASTQSINIDSAALGSLGTNTISVEMYDSISNCIIRDHITIDLILCVGISESETLNPKINIIPNPNLGEFDLVIESVKSENYSILIVDLFGKEIYSEDILAVDKIKHKISLNKIRSGYYYLICRTSAGVSAKKLSIQH